MGGLQRTLYPDTLSLCAFPFPFPLREDSKETSQPVDTTSKLALYQDCNTLVTRIEIIIMRLRKDKGVGIKGALQATQDPNVPKIIPVLYLV